MIHDLQWTQAELHRYQLFEVPTHTLSVNFQLWVSLLSDLWGREDIDKQIRCNLRANFNEKRQMVRSQVKVMHELSVFAERGPDAIHLLRTQRRFESFLEELFNIALNVIINTHIRIPHHIMQNAWVQPEELEDISNKCSEEHAFSLPLLLSIQGVLGSVSGNLAGMFPLLAQGNRSCCLLVVCCNLLWHRTRRLVTKEACICCFHPNYDLLRLCWSQLPCIRSTNVFFIMGTQRRNKPAAMIRIEIFWL